MTSWKIEQNEVVEFLRAYDGPRFQAVICDPPYALISIGKRFGKPGSAPAQEGTDGRFSRLSSGFMNAKWDSFQNYAEYRKWVTEWAVLLIERALHPGAVCLFFGGTRTWQHLAVGLEEGGFEVYDTLMWLTGQGFPKSHDVSKGIDNAAGAERDLKPGGMRTKGGDAYGASGNWKVGVHRSNEAMTSEAQDWQGRGTALKPSWEPILLCRAPRGKHTFAQLAQEFGTGALAIDETRIESGNRPKIESDRGRGSAATYAGGPTGDLHGSRAKGETRLGRWPANLILSHHEDCVKVGERTVPGRVINRWKDGMKPFGDGAGGEFEGQKMADETQEVWACVSECPVRQLDDRVGQRFGRASMGGGLHSGSERAMGWGMDHSAAGDRTVQYFDAGGPSRFFYTSKADPGEKDKGLEFFFWRRTEKGFTRITEEEWSKLPGKKRARGNIHPTVKPLDLIRYIASLILPPKQDGKPRRVLVPFSGSGSELIGCLKAGWDEAVGIEMDDDYNSMAKARIRDALGLFGGQYAEPDSPEPTGV